VTHRESETFEGPVVDVGSGTVSVGAKAPAEFVILSFEGFAETFLTKGRGKAQTYIPDKKKGVGFLVPKGKRGLLLTEEVLWPIVLEFHNTSSDKGKGNGEAVKQKSKVKKFQVCDIENIKNACSTFTAASFKSLLQKIIRFRPKLVALEDSNNTTLPSGFALSVTFSLLVLHPGSFVPDIQRYVSGLESAFKRLVVTLFEDAYFSPSRYNDVLSLAACALLAQRSKGWKPTKQLFLTALSIAQEALNDPRAFILDIVSGMKMRPYSLGGGATLHQVSALVDALRSFPSDLGMIRNIANRSVQGTKEIAVSFTNCKVQPSVMPLAHCVDQHWAPEIVYFFPPEVICKLKTPGSKPYSKLMIKIFSEVTGVNPRRPEGRRGSTMAPVGFDEKAFESSNFVKYTRVAQRLLLLSRQARMRPRDLVAPDDSAQRKGKDAKMDLESENASEEKKPSKKNKGYRTLVKEEKKEAELEENGKKEKGGMVKEKVKGAKETKREKTKKIKDEEEEEKQGEEKEEKGEGNGMVEECLDPPLKVFKTLAFTLDKSWIAGMLGAVEIKGRPPALVTLHPDDPELFVAVRKPSRDMKSPFLTDQHEATVIQKAKDLLLLPGLPLNQTPPPIPALKGCNLVRDKKSGEYFIYSKKSKDLVSWEQFRSSSVDIPYIKYKSLSLENALNFAGEGVVRYMKQRLDCLLPKTKVTDLRRALMYLSGFCSTVEFNRVGREGGGTQQVVTVDDVGAYQFVLRLSLLCPSAIQKVQGVTLRFKILIGPLLWRIREYISKFVSKKCGSCKKGSKRWGEVGDQLERTPWEHQLSALQEMKHSHSLARNGHFIWIPVGMGKTWIVLSYLKFLLKKGQLPKYVFYTLPSSAIQSIIHEVKSFGFNLRLLVPLKNLGKEYKTKSGRVKGYVVKGCRPEEYAINLIEHDHLRRCEEDLSTFMPDAVFIIDEVHKALNESKRTAVALQMSHLSQEFIALTGTPIIDSNTYKLIWWLEQIVPFSVNEKNFWVAANGMVAKKVNTGVRVEREEVVAPFNSEEHKLYHSFVPPALGGNNQAPQAYDLRKAMELCYATSTREMVNQVALLLKEKKRVFVVAKDNAHQEQLREMIVRSTKLRGGDIFLIGKGESIFLTEEAVRGGKVKGYEVVITTIRKSEGYTLTYLNSMVSSVYPSNNATREQIEGRINRIGQKCESVVFRVVHSGILTYILRRHNDARNLSSVLQAIADDIDLLNVS